MTKTKQEIIDHYQSFNQWVYSLTSLEQEQWLQPIRAGKWSTGEIISHFIFWDRYFYEKRLPLMKQDARLPKSTGTEAFNQIASEKARGGQSKEAIIRMFLYTRTQILAAIEAFTDDDLRAEFHIGDQKLSLSAYIDGLIEHDVHHQQQIEAFLGQKHS